MNKIQQSINELIARNKELEDRSNLYMVNDAIKLIRTQKIIAKTLK
jgi:hypothetical protein